MAFSIEAIYENGVPKSVQPLPLQEHEKVRITEEQADSPVHRAYGILGWAGTHAELEPLLAEIEELEDLP